MIGDFRTSISVINKTKQKSNQTMEDLSNTICQQGLINIIEHFTQQQEFFQVDAVPIDHMLGQNTFKQVLINLK